MIAEASSEEEKLMGAEGEEFGYVEDDEGEEEEEGDENDFELYEERS